ncbi:hypothetical protein [Robertkochia sediminum]|uniref:hypothetical protein n=1 Tax=Robertkochia sediminum TaxID=2785326 RepID=UPI0019320CD5|nr:hypothetical protein [Robertkochia sediminum]MBL7472127.1 hypothetical protein [Robertkochia sediminum]
MRGFAMVFIMLLALPLKGQEPALVCDSEAHSAFDFWVGTWYVLDREGEHVGVNEIRKVEGGCMISETYKSVTTPFTGRSLNFLNPDTGKWEQIWVDNQGNYLHLYGGLQNGVMVMQGDHGNGENRRSDKISWALLDDGRVRQLWERQKDSGEWTTIFEGFYVRIPGDKS